MESINSIARMIDHSILHPTFTDEKIRKGCELAKKNLVYAVCVKPYSITMVKSLLEGSTVKICAVVGFPHGSSTIGIKIEEARRACCDGAEEIDFVINIGKVLGQDWEYVSHEIHSVNEVARQHKAISKVIFENEFMDAGPYANEGAANTARDNLMADADPATTIAVSGGTTTITEALTDGKEYEQTIVDDGAGTTTISIITRTK